MQDNRVLVSMKGYIGDGVMTVPLLRAILGSGRQVSVQTSPAVQELLRFPGVDLPFLPLKRERSPWHVVRQAAELRGQFDAVVLVNRSFRSALIMRLAGIRCRIGHSHEYRSSLLTNAIPYDFETFEAWSQLDLVVPLGIEARRTLPVIEVSEAEKLEGKRLCDGADVAVQPGARFVSKQLPAATLTEVCRELQAKGHRLAFVGGLEERKISERVAASLGSPIVDLVGKTSLRQTMGVLNGLRAFLGSDTGILHVGAAVGSSIVQVLRPSVVNKWGHRYEPHRVLEAPEGRMDRVAPNAILQAIAEVSSR